MTAEAPPRFLLDQNFPTPPFEGEALDAAIKYERVHEFDPTLVEKQTPDWLIYAAAERAGTFAGVVTRDVSQVRQEEELVMLTATRLSVVTWSRSMEDPVAEWGQILAYMPVVVTRIAQDGPSIFFLPKPQLRRRDSIVKASDLLVERAKRDSTSVREIRHAAIRVMTEQLEERGREDLSDVVERAARPRPR